MMNRLPSVLCWIGLWAAGVLATPAGAQEPGFSFSYGPVPAGWSDAVDLNQDYGEGWWWTFSRTYDTEYDESTLMYSTPHIDVFVIEGSYDALVQMMGASYRGTSLKYAGWDLGRLREAYAEVYPADELTITQVGASEVQTTLDGRPAVRHMHETEWTYIDTDPTSRGVPSVSRRRLLVYWVDLGATGVGVVADLTSYDSHSVTMGQLEASAVELIETFRFGPPTAGEGAEPGDGGVPWEVVIGAGALAAILTTVARNLLRKSNARKEASGGARSESERESPDERSESPVGYILQLSSARLQLQPDSPAELTITAWRVDGDGAYHPAPEAQLLIAVPRGLGETVRVSPTQGEGQMTCRVALVQPVPVKPTPLRVSARAPGGATSAEVLVEAEPVYTLEFF